MNGIASEAMGRKSEDYRVNFGVEIPRLHNIATEFQPSHELAQHLWKESVRECRILATILQPVDSFLPEIADIWVDDIRTLELAQVASLNLFSRLPYASDKCSSGLPQSVKSLSSAAILPSAILCERAR